MQWTPRLARMGQKDGRASGGEHGPMSNRSLVELNHDHCPGSDRALLVWANKMLNYLRSGDKRDLPDGVTFKHMRHHSGPDPMAGRGDPS